MNLENLQLRSNELPQLLAATKAQLAKFDKERIRNSLTEWARICGFEPAKHHQLVIDRLEAVERGETLRQMIFMPPGSAKSTYVSVLFPPWFMSRHKQAKIIEACHTADFAEQWGRSVRNLVSEYHEVLGLELMQDSKAADRWGTTSKAKYYAVGVAGAISGVRGDLVIIDDPVKSSEVADSQTSRDKIWRWYKADLIPRLTPNARIVFIMTRWHEDDLAGRLLNEAAKGGQDWNVLELPAQCERAGDPLGRRIGEYLWTEGEYGYGKLLEELKLIEPPRNWSALYQQHPTPLEGGMFQVQWWQYCGAVPAGARGVRSWDFAATAEEHKSPDPDYTVGLRMWETEGRYYIDDVVRFRGTPMEVDHALHDTASKDGKALPIEIPLDPGAAGKADAEYKIRCMAGWQIHAEPERAGSSTATRAGPFASQVQARNVFLVKGPWNASFVEELATYPNGRHDDQVSAGAKAFMALCQPRGIGNIPKRALDYAHGRLR